MAEIEVKNIAEAQEILENLSETAPLNKPTEEEINLATQDFNAKAADFNGKKFLLGEAKEALEIYEEIIG